MIKNTCLAFCILVYSAVATAHTLEHPYYVGGTLAQARGDVGADEMNERMAFLGYDAQAVVRHKNRAAWGLLVGYTLSPHFDFELGYTDLGKVKTQLSGSAVDINDYLNSANLVHPRSADGAEIALLGRYPLNHKLEVFARTGMLFTHSDYFADAELDNASRSNSSREFIYGFGLNYEANSRWKIRAGWNRYKVEKEKIDLIGVSLFYRFSCCQNNAD